MFDQKATGWSHVPGEITSSWWSSSQASSQEPFLQQPSLPWRLYLLSMTDKFSGREKPRQYFFCDCRRYFRNDRRGNAPRSGGPDAADQNLGLRPTRRFSMIFSSESQTWWTCADVRAPKNGSAIVREETYSVTGNSPPRKSNFFRM